MGKAGSAARATEGPALTRSVYAAMTAMAARTPRCRPNRRVAAMLNRPAIMVTLKPQMAMIYNVPWQPSLSLGYPARPGWPWVLAERVQTLLVQSHANR
jgi:hypothetical protein